MPPGRWYGHFVVQVVIISGPIPFEGLVAGVMPLHTGELRAGLGCRLLAGAVFGLTVGTNALAWLGQSAGADNATAEGPQNRLLSDDCHWFDPRTTCLPAEEAEP